MDPQISVSDVLEFSDFAPNLNDISVPSYGFGGFDKETAQDHFFEAYPKLSPEGAK